MKNFAKRRVNGFTLIELLIVLAVIGILIALAIPKQGTVVSKAKATEAKMQLKHLYSLQKSYFYEFSKYSNSADEIGFEQEKLTSEGGNANYTIEIVSASPSGFTARATAMVDFDQDGAMNVWEINEKNELKEITKD
jgi:type IV pilus assembly protein PilE